MDTDRYPRFVSLVFFSFHAPLLLSLFAFKNIIVYSLPIPWAGGHGNFWIGGLMGSYDGLILFLF
jgi:hypothetical protein